MYVLKQFINQIIAAKHQIMKRSQLEKMNSDQLVQSYLLMEYEFLGKETEMLQQNNMINERPGDYQKSFKIL